MTRPVMAVIGQGGTVPPPVHALAFALGTAAVDAGFRILTGGLGGVMEAASRGAHASSAYREGDVIGILPGSDPAARNRFVDIAIPTGLGVARNVIVVSSADVVVAVAGGAGTLSELALAWQLGRPIIGLGDTGWAGRLRGEAIDARRPDVIERADDPHAAVALAQARLGAGQGGD